MIQLFGKEIPSKMDELEWPVGDEEDKYEW